MKQANFLSSTLAYLPRGWANRTDRILLKLLFAFLSIRFVQQCFTQFQILHVYYTVDESSRITTIAIGTGVGISIGLVWALAFAVLGSTPGSGTNFTSPFMRMLPIAAFVGVSSAIVLIAAPYELFRLATAYHSNAYLAFGQSVVFVVWALGYVFLLTKAIGRYSYILKLVGAVLGVFAACYLFADLTYDRFQPQSGYVQTRINKIEIDAAQLGAQRFVFRQLNQETLEKWIGYVSAREALTADELEKNKVFAVAENIKNATQPPSKRDLFLYFADQSARTFVPFDMIEVFGWDARDFYPGRGKYHAITHNTEKWFFTSIVFCFRIVVVLMFFPFISGFWKDFFANDNRRGAA